MTPMLQLTFAAAKRIFERAHPKRPPYRHETWELFFVEQPVIFSEGFPLQPDESPRDKSPATGALE